VVPNATGRVALLAPALAELIEALGYAGLPPGGRPALAAIDRFGQMGAVFLTARPRPCSPAVLGQCGRAPGGSAGGRSRRAGSRRSSPSARSSGSTGRGRGHPARGVAIVRAADAARLLGPPSVDSGCVSRRDRLVLGFATQPLHGIDPAWLAVLALGVLGVAGLVTADASQRERASRSSSCSRACRTCSRSPGSTAGSRARRRDDGDLAGAPVLFVAGVALLGLLLSLVLRWQAAAPILTIATAPVAGAAGLSPLVVAIVATIACSGFLAPYQSTTYLALYHGTGGRLFDHRLARPAAIAYALVVSSRSASACRSGAGWGSSARPSGYIASDRAGQGRVDVVHAGHGSPISSASVIRRRLVHGLPSPAATT
jgi:hypothetical protein